MRSLLAAAGVLAGAVSLGLSQGDVHAPEPIAPGSSAPATVSRPVLTLAGAEAVLGRARAECVRVGASPSVAVVDAGGHLLAFARLDGSFAAGAEVSMGKARTAAVFKKPTRAFEDAINGGRAAMLDARPDFTPLRGGVPVVVDGEVVGAVGVSGAASAQQDDEIATGAAGALSAGGAGN